MIKSQMEMRLERAKQEGDTAFIELAAFVEYVCANGDEIHDAHIVKYAYEARDTLGDRIPDPDGIDYEEADKKYAEVVKAHQETARECYGCDDIQIDDDANLSFADDGVWVQAWVWLQDEDEDNP